jgi:uncharacterized membrane protein
MTHRMVTAVLALIGLFVSLYLYLWKLGLMGPLICTTGGCETVQLSEYAVFFGVPVALWGIMGFASLLAVSIAGLHGRWVELRGPTVVLAVLSATGMVFVGYLTYLEANLIRAWCQWCIACAILVTIIFLISLVTLRHWPAAQPGA